MTNVADPEKSGLATFLIFVGVSFKSMVTVLSITVIITALVLAFFQIYTNFTKKGDNDIRTRMIPHVLGVSAVMLLCGAASEPDMPSRLMFDLVTTVASLCVLMLSVIPSSQILVCSRAVTVVMVMVSIYHLLCASGLVRQSSDCIYLALSGVVSASLPVIFMYMICIRIRDVKSVIKSGNVWSFVTLCVDVFYVSVPLVLLVLQQALSAVAPVGTEVAYVIMILLFLEMLALGIKAILDSAFVVMHDHERLIVESMKISRMDVGPGGEFRGEDRYKDLYERIEHYFEKSRPYLDGDLTINDVVKVVYSNKVYISQAICHYTGRNFRQFVNYHRVMHSMDLFRNNLEFKVAELADKSGFNNVVSYTMAFRLFMNETPSEWCRKERAKILKPKK